MVLTRIWGPLRSHVFYLALDTGATDTIVSAKLLTDIGYDFTSRPLVQIMTGNGIVQVPDLKVSRLESLGQQRSDFSVLAHELSPKATIDGVLGLDFLRGHVLNLDFRLGKITLE